MLELQQKINSYYSDIEFSFNILKRYRNEAELYLSNRFNVFDYLSDDENSLSNIIRDILKPDGSHGQGNTFLNEFFSLLKSFPSLNLNEPAPPYYIRREIPTSLIENNLRRMDILIEWGNCGIMIENKPWAIDGENQLSHYKDYLQKRFIDKFIVVYLSKNELPPSETSISSKDLKLLTNSGQFIQISYGYGFKGWLNNCVTKCQSDKYRWFLRDFVKYVETNFK